MENIALTSYNHNGLELFIDQQTGECFATIRASARMCESSDSTIRDFVGARKWSLKTAEVITGGGLQGARLLNESQIAECLAKYNPALLVQCTKAGLRVYLYGLAGYQAKSQRELTRLEILEIAMEAEKENLSLKAKIAADEPATILGKAITKAKNNLRIGEFAKSIGMGQNKYFEELRECQIIMATSTLPYQRFISSGYFVVTQVIHNEKTYPVSLVTPKGQAYLAKRHQQYLASIATMRIVEAEVSALV